MNGVKCDSGSTERNDFSLGLRDISAILYQFSCQAYRKLNSLLYADDVIFLSRFKVGLQNCLNTLSSYCNFWMQKINTMKTKIVIFQKCRGKWDSSFFIYVEKIDIVQNYTYLGGSISSSGDFMFSLDHLQKWQTALHALSSLIRHTDLKLILKPSLVCKIFHSMISPIFTYDSEVWSTFVKSDFKSCDNSPIEKAHLNDVWKYIAKRWIW